MRNHIDRLLFAVRFAYEKLNEYPEQRVEKWRELRAEVARFLGEGEEGGPLSSERIGIYPRLKVSVDARGMPTRAIEWPLPYDLTIEDIKRLQKQTRQCLESAADNNWSPVTRMTRFVIMPPLRGKGVPRRFFFYGPTQEMFLLTLAFLLTILALNRRLHRCPAPMARRRHRQCGHVFLRLTKSKYCGKACTDRASKPLKSHSLKSRTKAA